MHPKITNVGLKTLNKLFKSNVRINSIHSNITFIIVCCMHVHLQLRRLHHT